MAKSRPPRSEIPPTAGLPPRWRDLSPFAGNAPHHGDLARCAADFLGVEEVQVECSGTASLVVALTAMHRLSGRRAVIVPAYTCPLVALAVAHCGLELRLCDLAPGSIDFDAAQLARLCDRDTLAAVPTHLAGRVADVGTALAIAREAGAFVIEDAAQALGARRGGRPVGLDGDAGFFSLAVGKGLTTFEGGLLVARDAPLRRELARTSREIVPYRFGWELERSLQLLGYHALYRPSLLGLAYGAPLRRALRRGDPVAAVGDDFSADIPLHTLGRWRQSVGARAFARLPSFLQTCTAQAMRRKTRLARIAGVTLIDDPADAAGSWPFLLLRLRDEATRDAALRVLWGAGLGVSRLFIRALPDYGYLQPFVGEHQVPNARAFAATTLTISSSPWLDDEAFEAICTVLQTVATAA
ncbi:DegT/DnrJ/EryC1/StrS family aminotransferase [Dokdonella sp.]|uniref:DegT/DnrJ/EryC1/StrS family aminotransferase n=1 Tax=Dokdonella sp. TaxID=2291710 RepID=UPI001AFED4F4|nr:DegT/DnrJ/EryC1/StrS family aminotransferase [Dokdonella sp.]MBO9664983.1 DegT/DnrJ/EryC1/StrS family aminotransferase [Dokdonella sp.]